MKILQAKKILYHILPKDIFVKLRNIYRNRQLHKFDPLSKSDLKNIFLNHLNLKNGDNIMIHSSLDFLYTNCNSIEILELLIDCVGSEGTLLFPSWHFNYRAEKALKEELVFNVKKSPSVLGMLSETARRYPNAKRSLHPTNSIVAIGKNADYFTKSHHLNIYPCGEESPFYKLKLQKGKVIGIGVDTNFLSFVHCPEDILKNEFPLKTRLDNVFKGKVINYNNEVIYVETLVASEDIKNNDIRKFIKNNISENICRDFEINKNRFFIADCSNLFDQIVELSKKNITIYN